MRHSIRLGQVHGIPVGLHWSTAVILILVAEGFAVGVLPVAAPGYTAVAYWLAAAGFAGMFLVSLLAHEYAHARTAQHYGVRVRSITLWLLGGVSELDGETPHPRGDLLVALAGPAASLAAAGSFLLAAGPAGLAHLRLLEAGFADLAVVNAVLAVFNLLPGAPLDGGRALAAILWWLRGDRAAARLAATRAGILLGSLLAVAGIVLTFSAQFVGGLWFVLLGWYLVMTASGEAAASRLLTGIGDVPVERLMSAPPICGYTSQTVAAFVAEVAAAHPHRCYPVVEVDGRLAGLVTLRILATVPVSRRSEVRLNRILVPVSRIPVAPLGTPVREPSAQPVNPLRCTVVVDGGRPCGVLTAGDLARALAIAELRNPGGSVRQPH
ncbi:site-2 protease family protein [Actinoplanes sp. KI2]|uniref:site-2 protease family protein n=1 Tax=Actinoplanes sp. KI2 TaxID=2983315 RepID=UPI0021D5863A|nr:site-2 protease family protein [Actinoplanes sp. KI2]MCU7729449.1 site-2 protease family protein [Actinoplanes sp. KI2]